MSNDSRKYHLIVGDDGETGTLICATDIQHAAFDRDESVIHIFYRGRDEQFNLKFEFPKVAQQVWESLTQKTLNLNSPCNTERTV